jgi:hypothetical protein
MSQTLYVLVAFPGSYRNWEEFYNDFNSLIVSFTNTLEGVPLGITTVNGGRLTVTPVLRIPVISGDMRLVLQTYRQEYGCSTEGWAQFNRQRFDGLRAILSIKVPDTKDLDERNGILVLKR